MLLPLMAASFIAYGVSTMICKQPIYRALSEAFVWVEPETKEDEKPEEEEGEAAPAEGEANTAADDKPSDRV
jgi:hypothetical protein